MSFIDAHRGRSGVGPVCAEVPIAPSTYYEHKAREGEPERAPGRVRRDGWLCGEIHRVDAEPFGVYGVRKVWRQLRREGVAVARGTVARRMRRLGLQGAVRGRRAKTTRAVVQGERPDDRVNREFKVSRPNALWVSDLTYVATWRGFAYTAFVIDAYARRIVGWRVSHSLHTDLALDALEQALHERCAPREGLVHHSDSRRWPPDSSQSPSGKPGAVHFAGGRFAEAGASANPDTTTKPPSPHGPTTRLSTERSGVARTSFNPAGVR